jgi:hypothetical protein
LGGRCVCHSGSFAMQVLALVRTEAQLRNAMSNSATAAPAISLTWRSTRTLILCIARHSQAGAG